MFSSGGEGQRERERKKNAQKETYKHTNTHYYKHNEIKVIAISYSHRRAFSVCFTHDRHSGIARDYVWGRLELPSWSHGQGRPVPSRLEGLRERRELPQWGSGQSPGRKRIFCIF